MKKDFVSETYINVTIEAGAVAIRFPDPEEYLTLTAEDARRLASALIRESDRLDNEHSLAMEAMSMLTSHRSI